MQYVSRNREDKELAKKEISRDISRSKVESAIDEWIIGKHAERNRQILKRRMLDGICFEPLAEEFDMSVRQIKNIVYKEWDRVARHIPF